MKNVTLIAISIGTLVILYSIISGNQVKKVDLGGKTSIEFFPKQPSKQPKQPSSIYNSDHNQGYGDESLDEMMKRTNTYIDCLNTQGSGCFQSP